MLFPSIFQSYFSSNASSFDSEKLSITVGCLEHMSSALIRARQKSTPGEIEVRFEKMTLTELDELGVELDTLTGWMVGPSRENNEVL